MDIFDLLITIWQSVASHKLRTFLTTLGILIGVASVILLMAIGNGIRNYLINQFRKLGSNMVYVMPGNLVSEDGQLKLSSEQEMFFAKPLKAEYDRVLAKLDHVRAASVIAGAPAKARRGKKQYDVGVRGVRAAYFTIRQMDYLYGGGFDRQAQQGKLRQVVLGFNAADELFGVGTDPVGRSVVIGSAKFEVVGVVDKIGSTMGGPNLDDYVYIPYPVLLDLFPQARVMAIVVGLDDINNFAQFKRQAEKALIKQGLTSDDFTILSQKELESSITAILNILSFALSGIAAISLLVGGIGIMNIMLVSVTERTREIGLRKALGARYRDIMIQFLLESSVLGLLGGGLGLALGFVGSLMLTRFIPAQVGVKEVLLALSVSFITGIVFGVAPARQAARLNPIDALRYE